MVSWLPSSCAASSWPCTSHPALKPRRITEQGGRDLNRTLQLGFLFLGGAALLVASPLGLAMCASKLRDVPYWARRNLGYPNFTRRPFSIGVGRFHHRPIITRIQAARGLRDRSRSCLKEGWAMLEKSPPNNGRASTTIAHMSWPLQSAKDA